MLANRSPNICVDAAFIKIVIIKVAAAGHHILWVPAELKMHLVVEIDLF